MSNNSSANRVQSGMPSDDQMDSLLSDFFRLEVPTELNQPLRQNQLAAATATTSKVVAGRRVEQPRSRTVRFVAVAASVAAMALAVLVVISGNNGLPLNGSGLASGTTGDTKSPGTTPEIDQPMLVSPEGDSRTPTKAIGPDGVTLEETDTIELHQQK
ncbi:MAG: hypothetical protein WKF77_31135 [Planctomycetaceae bacterium]